MVVSVLLKANYNTHLKGKETTVSSLSRQKLYKNREKTIWDLLLSLRDK